MRLALISDIHGNLPALEAVLADLEQAGTMDKVWILGDLCAFGTQPLACLHRVRQLQDTLGKDVCQVIGGNTDRYLALGHRPKARPVKEESALQSHIHSIQERDAVLNWALAQLNYDDYSYLTGILGRELSWEVPEYGRVIGFHAIPGDDEPMSLRPDTADEEAEDTLLDREGWLAVCGHTHRWMDRKLDHWRVINPGSVGLSFTQIGMAEWAYVTFDGAQAEVTFHNVPFDAKAILEEAIATGYPAVNMLKESFEIR